MNYLDILYTPLDAPCVPEFDVDNLLNWVSTHHVVQHIDRRVDASKLIQDYPWDIIYPKTKGEWQYGFDDKFPKLANHFNESLNLEPEDITGVVLLPIKSAFSGLGFWHSDPDSLGIRMYLENRETSDFLYIKPTVEPYTIRPTFNITHIPLQETKVHSARLMKSTQMFFINNVRAMHAVNVPKSGVLRIATILFVKPAAEEHIKDLIVKSAEKFKDYSIMWTPPNNYV